MAALTTLRLAMLPLLRMVQFDHTIITQQHSDSHVVNAIECINVEIQQTLMSVSSTICVVLLFKRVSILLSSAPKSLMKKPSSITAFAD